MATLSTLDGPVLDVARVRADFPVFACPRGRPLVYLDSAASSQKPVAVIEAMDDYYRTTHANVHRGVYAMASMTATGFCDDAAESR